MTDATATRIMILCFLILCTIVIIAHISATKDEIIEELKEASEEDE